MSKRVIKGFCPYCKNQAQYGEPGVEFTKRGKYYEVFHAKCFLDQVELAKIGREVFENDK